MSPRVLVFAGLVAVGPVGVGMWLSAMDKPPSVFRASPAPPAALALGSSGAPHRLVVFSDYECAVCALLEREVGAELRALAEKGGLRLDLRHFPLSAHRRARRAAIASLCAEQQGGGWTMHAALLRTAPTWRSGAPSEPWFLHLGDSLGLERTALAACLRDPGAAEDLEADLALGRALGLTAVPAIFFDGRAVPLRTPRALLRRVRRSLE